MGSWPEGPRRGGTDVHKYVQTKYPPYSTGHRPSGAAAQKVKEEKKERQTIQKVERKRKTLQILSNIDFISARQSVEGQVIDQECIKEGPS